MAKPVASWEDTPAILYKYRTFDPDRKHLKALENAELFFPSPRHFNDPFDCSLHYDLDGLESGLALRWAVDFVGRELPHLVPDQRESLARRRWHEIRSQPDYAKRFHDYVIETNQHKFGICSLTPLARNLLMWAHYAEDHKGFCVGINMLAMVPFQNDQAKQGDLIDLYKVEYAEAMPRINFFQSMLSETGDDDALTLITTKSTDWKYEQEYRLVRWHKADSCISIGRGALAWVILGCRTSDENREQVLMICRNNRVPFPVFQAHQEEFRFALRFKRIR